MALSLFLNLFFLELGPHKEFRFIQNAIPGEKRSGSKFDHQIYSHQWGTIGHWRDSMILTFHVPLLARTGLLELDFGSF